MSLQKVIVTGGMGYIGSHTIVELINAGYHPIIIDNLSNSDRSVLEGLEAITGVKVPFEEIDLSDSKSTTQIFSKHADAIGVIHFAALKAVGESVEQPIRYYKNNIGSLVNVLEAMANLKIENFIFSSSCTVYGQPEKLPVTELSPTQPAISPYGNTKQVGEEIIKETCSTKSSELHTISLRYFNPIGAHNSALIGELPLGIPNNLLPYITQTAIGIREQLSVFGSDYNTPDGTAIRDYIHVVDLAEAHVVALTRLIQKQNKSNYEVFNLGTGQGNSVLEVIQSFEKSTGEKVNYKIVDRRPGDVEAVYADTTYAREELGWATKRNLDEMTASAWAWEKKLRG
jgi:UDP-glucose 4-epimerase